MCWKNGRKKADAGVLEYGTKEDISIVESERVQDASEQAEPLEARSAKRTDDEILDMGVQNSRFYGVNSA